jgi:hypothetical protein
MENQHKPAPRKHLFFRDRDRYGYQVTVWHGEEADRSAEKDLGRNLLSIQFGRAKARQMLILSDYHRYP